MQQPELGKRLTALRKEKNLTQEELVEKSHVSVRTIQRIEAGEVLPRMSTVRILLGAMGESFESFTTPTSQAMPTPISTAPHPSRDTLLTAALAGAIYLVAEIVLGGMDIAWITYSRDWDFKINLIYTSLTVVMVVAFTLFARGFIALSTLFENKLLKVVAYVLILAVAGMGVLDISTLSTEDPDQLLLIYIVPWILMGALTIAFGVSLVRLQDSMGMLARIAGILEIVMGCMMVTVVLFFFTYVVLVPATVVEILLLYRAYEYLSRSEPTAANT